MSGAAVDYDFSTKRHWRRTMWNAIKERLSVPASEAVVLYLPGPTDEDRAIALSKGFRAENLFAVERDRGVVKELRAAGSLVIHGDFLEVAQSWPVGHRCDVLFSDFTGNFRLDVAQGFEIVTAMPQFKKCVFAVNMLGGREAGRHRDALLWLQRCSGGHKNRAAHLCFLCTLTAMDLANGNLSLSIDGDSARFVLSETANRSRYFEGWTGEQMDTWERAVQDVLRRQIFSYRNFEKRQPFHSCVWVNPLSHPDVKLDFSPMAGIIRRLRLNTPSRKSLSAFLAHRTMRAAR